MVLVCSINTFLLSMWCWYAFLDCFVPPVWLSFLLCIFARLPICSCMSLYVVHTPIQWNYGHLIQTYLCPPRTPSFCLITCFFASLFASHDFLLCIFARLPTCSRMSLYVVHTPIQWNYGHSIQTYLCPPKTPSFCLITYFFASLCASHVCMPSFGIFC